MLFCLSLWPVYRPWTLQLQCSFSSSCVTVPKPSMKATRMLTEGTEQIRSALLYLECQQSFPMTSWKVFLPREKWSWFSPDPSKKKRRPIMRLVTALLAHRSPVVIRFCFQGSMGEQKLQLIPFLERYIWGSSTVFSDVLGQIFAKEIIYCRCGQNDIFSVGAKKNEGPVLTNIDVKTIFVRLGI